MLGIYLCLGVFGGVWARWSEGIAAASQDTPGEKKREEGGWDGIST